MKMLLIYPPQWIPTSPYLSVPLLAGQLRAAGYEADTLDLNVRFFRSILNEAHLRSCLDRAKEIYRRLCETIPAEYPDAEARFASFDPETKTLLLRFRKLGAFLSSNRSELERSSFFAGNTARFDDADAFLSLDEIVGQVEDAVNVLRSKTDFYDPEKLFDAKMIVQEALKIASLPYAPNELIWDNYFCSPFLPMNWENINKLCRDPMYNMYIDFFVRTAEELARKDYDGIGISVPDLSQIVGGFTLARILKEKTGAKVFLGGNYITQNKEDFKRHPELFGEYADGLMTGDGELSIVKIASFLEGRTSIGEIYGMLYRAPDGTVAEGPVPPRLRMDDTVPADFSDVDLSLYYSPEIVLPFQFSKGCYWGKCAFCDYYYGQQCFDIKSVGRAVDEMELYQKQYGISHFLFIDEAIPPKYYERFAKEVLRRKLRVFYYSFARLEREFTPETLRTLYASGCRILMWGYECSAPRLLEMMNKGIAPDTRLDIIRASHNAGIWNNALFIIGYPTETAAEIEETLNVIKNNRDIINSCTPSNFSLKKNAVIMKDAAANGVKSYAPKGEFYTVYADEIDGVSQQERREIRRQFHLDFITENRNCLWPVVYSDFDNTLLYLERYGLPYVSGYRSKRAICPMFR